MPVRTSQNRDLVFVTTVDLAAANGPAMHAINLVNAMAASDVRITLVAARALHATVLPIDPRVTIEWTANPRALGLPGTLGNIAALRQVWRHRRAACVYVRSAPGSIVLSAVARALVHGRLMVEFNGWLADEASVLGYGPWMARGLAWSQKLEARLADHVRVVTASLRLRSIEAGARPDNVSVIPTGTRLDVFTPLDRAACRRELGLVSERPIAVFVGSLWQAIDFATTFDAIALLAKAGTLLDLIIVGDGPERAALEQKARDRADLRIVFTGSQPPHVAARYVGASDVTLAPFVRARNEAIGLSPLKLRDYAAAGRVVVATNLPDIEIFGAQPWMFLAAPEDAEDMARALQLALQPSIGTDRAAAEKSAHDYAIEHFGWDRVARDVLAAALPAAN